MLLFSHSLSLTVSTFLSHFFSFCFYMSFILSFSIFQSLFYSLHLSTLQLFPLFASLCFIFPFNLIINSLQLFLITMESSSLHKSRSNTAIIATTQQINQTNKGHCALVTSYAYVTSQHCNDVTDSMAEIASEHCV